MNAITLRVCGAVVFAYGDYTDLPVSDNVGTAGMQWLMK
jgi:hypothetical protein